jgi:hypothetical protein
MNKYKEPVQAVLSICDDTKTAAAVERNMRLLLWNIPVYAGRLFRKKGKSHIAVTQRGKKFMKKCSCFEQLLL